MTTDAATWGPRLFAYLEQHWRAQGTNGNAWANQHPGIQAPTLWRWREGTVPSLSAMIAVADALGVDPVEVLVVAGALDEAPGRKARKPEPPSIDAAIDHDPTLVSWQRTRLREILAAMREVESGAQVATNTKGRKSRR